MPRWFGNTMTSSSRAEDCPCLRPRKQLYQQAIILIYQQPCLAPPYHVRHYVLAREARYAHLRGQLRRRAAVCKLQSLLCANFPAHTTQVYIAPSTTMLVTRHPELLHKHTTTKEGR